MTNKEGTRKQISLKDMKEGDSVIGYVKDLFKAPKSLTPDSENIALVQKDGTEITVWASGDLKYFREKMERAGVSLGVLTKITRTARRANVKATSKQKYFADVKFNPADTVDPSTIGTTYSDGSSLISDF